MKLLGLVPNSYIYVYVYIYLYFPRIGLPILLLQNIGRPILGIYKSLTDNMNVEIGKQNIIILLWK
jgi:hypothetical protein